ncbi:MAG: B12-binding domain-containing radical SAM protein, partial [Coriobacteriia bacterium]|nr:B12-binding domain-containing radical SAM protein [Coriobacteriia bacterium]
MSKHTLARVALIEAGSPGLNIYSHVAMGRGAPLLAAVLRDAGYEVRAFIEDISGKDSIDWEYVRGARFVGFSAITCTLPRTTELISRVRSENPDATIILGGPEPSCAPERGLGAAPDFVLRGESELTLPRLFAALLGEGAEKVHEIPGLVWREAGDVRHGPEPEQLTRAQLDALPLVDRSLVHSAEKNSVAAVWRTRGCPDRCDFCEVVQIWPRCVRRSDERTLDELMNAQAEGYSTAFLVDDNAAANKQAFKDFLRQVIERGYARMLVTQLRADSVLRSNGRIDRELLRLLKKAASVTVVCVGVESADDTELAQVNKRIDAKRMARGLKAMRRYGLLVHGMFIALRDDTQEIIRRNGSYARRYVTSLQYLFETPLPGTKRTRQHERDGALLFASAADLELFDGMHAVLKPERMGPWEMQHLVVREYRRFYSLRRIVTTAIKGAFGRFRRLSEPQRAWLRQQKGWRRRLWWRMRMEIEYRFAATSFLAIGRKRVRAILADPGYAAFVERL